MVKTAEKFGDRVKRLRKSLGFTQPVLAEKSDLSIQTIKDIETNRNPGGAKSYLGLSRALGVSIEELLEGENPQPNRVVVSIAPSDVLRKYLKIPDEVVDLAAHFPPDHMVWKEVMISLEGALEDMKSDGGNGEGVAGHGA